MTHASVFSGIGGPEVAASMLGWENLFHCEINPFGRAVLDYWYPNAESYEDITKTDFSKWGGKLTCSQEVSLVSPSVTPGSDEERTTTAISGRSCTGVLTKSDPIGSFVRMLLESRRWSNKATLLRWQTQPTYSERTTDYEDTDSERPLPLNASAVTLRQTDMQSSRCLFRLVPLEPRTGETACSSSGEGLLPTPVVVDNPHPNSKVNEQGRRYNHKAESSHSMGLADLALHHLLPTPKGLAADVGSYSLLSPLYTQEMMGFPLGWTEHPFLSTNGGRKPSKPTATPSSRK